MRKLLQSNQSPNSPISRFPSFPVSLILLVSAVLRFQGLAWGLPNARHWFSYHPDEALILRAAANVNLFAGHLDPGFYNYGSFLIYCISLVSQVLDAWSPLKSFPNEMARMTLVGRWEVALFGVATVYVVYLIGNRIAGRRAGLFAAAIMAILPMHVVHSHFVTVDVPATFWVTVALYNALRWPEDRRAALWCGLAAGIAAGTKYNAGLVLLAGWAAIALHRGAGLRAGDRRGAGLRAGDRRGTGLRAGELRGAGLRAGGSLRALLLMTASTVAAFLLTTPGVLLNTPAFLRDFGYEANHVRTGHGLVFVNTGPGWWYHLSTNLRQGIGAFLPLGVLLAVIGLSVVHRRKPVARTVSLSPSPALPLAAFAIPYFAVISAAAVRFQRYDLPLLPVLAVGAGIAFARLSGRARLVPVLALLGTLILAQGAVSTMADPGGHQEGSGFTFHMDPRDAVADWFDRAVTPGVTIGLTREPWFFSPPFSVANGGPQTARIFEQERGRRRHRLQILGPTADAFEPRPDYVVISDYEYGDALRLQGAIVPERMAQLRPVSVDPASPAEAQRLARLWNTLMTQYDLVGLWSPRERCMGLSWPKRTLPPHDAFYSYPTLIVFRRGQPADRR